MDVILQRLQGLILFTAGALILGLLSFRVLQRHVDNPGRVVVKGSLTAALGYTYFVLLKPMSGEGGQSALMAVMLATIVGALLAVLWVPTIMEFITHPIMEWFAGGWFADDSKPYYALAKGLRKRGDHEAALEGIEQQLEKFPDDITGRLLKAEIHAEDLGDVDAAAQVVDEIIALDENNRELVPKALKNLADWRLRIDGDPERAEAVLQRLIGLFPESEPASEAGKLIKRIPDRERLRVRPEARNALQPKPAGARIRVTAADKSAKPESRKEPGQANVDGKAIRVKSGRD